MWPRLVAKKLLCRQRGGISSVADFPSEDELRSSTFGEIKKTDKYRLFAGTWNVAGIPPSKNLNLGDWLETESTTYDIYILGFQEVVPLNAKNVLGPENNRVSLKWHSLISRALNAKPSSNFQCVVSKQMVGIMVSVWVRAELHPFVKHTSVSCVGCGIMGYLGNKKAVFVTEMRRCVFLQGSVSFLRCVLSFGFGRKEGDELHRNSNAMEIFSRTKFPSEPSLPLPKHILDHERVILLGDLNYRISFPEEETLSLVLQKEWDNLLQKDQLKGEITEGGVFGGWNEGAIDFSPTYKYCPNSEKYYGSQPGEKKRAPAWCDRILWRGDGMKQTGYGRCELRHSDHRPVRASLTVEVEALVHWGSSETLYFVSSELDRISYKLRELLSEDEEDGMEEQGDGIAIG
ncbi:hypothetical protein HPP92_016405 [Vanilla planifolia]|uniref:Inositol polyphosphate-related phosphatase domain-containing protein n=1 Tax=Vanilla planifolia TaxID=51239 RepID=A0A835UR86_VANPL|nr:hypothetical protein HPP92_016405 [Vanilla planifolia]